MTPEQRKKLAQLRERGFGLPAARDLADAMDRQQDRPGDGDGPVAVALTLLAIGLLASCAWAVA